MDFTCVFTYAFDTDVVYVITCEKLKIHVFFGTMEPKVLKC